MGRRKSWTDEEFRRAVAVAVSLTDLAQLLGLAGRNAQQNEVFRRHARRLGLTLPTAKPGPRPQPATAPTPASRE
jgi:hypothetical protein